MLFLTWISPPMHSQQFSPTGCWRVVDCVPETGSCSRKERQGARRASSSRPGSLLPSDLRMVPSSPELNLYYLSRTKHVQISSSVLISCNQPHHSTPTKLKALSKNQCLGALDIHHLIFETTTQEVPIYQHVTSHTNKTILLPLYLNLRISRCFGSLKILTGFLWFPVKKVGLGSQRLNFCWSKLSFFSRNQAISLKACLV